MRNLIRKCIRENFDVAKDWILSYGNSKLSKSFSTEKTRKQVMDWAEGFYGVSPDDLWVMNSIHESASPKPAIEPEVEPEVEPGVKPRTEPEPSPFEPPPFVKPGEEPRPKLRKV